MDPDTSIASMIVVELDATGTVACGRAAPTPSVAKPSISSRRREQPGPPRTAGQRGADQGDRGHPHRRAPSAPPEQPGDSEQERDDQQRHQRPRPAEGHQTSLPVRTPVSSAPTASSASATAMNAAGQRHVLLGHGQPQVDGGGDTVELAGVGCRVVAAAGGLRDGGQLVGVQGGVQPEAVDLDGRPGGGADADRLDVHAGVLGDRRCRRRRVAAAPVPPGSSPSENSTMVAEPQYPRSGSAPSSPIVTDLPVIALSEPRMAAASDVPPEVRRFCTAAFAAARSALGSEVVSAPWSKPTTPMSTVSGWASMNAERRLLRGRQPARRDVVGRSCCWTRPWPG